MRLLKYKDAVREALDACLAEDDRVYVQGLGVPGPTGVFGTTAGLAERHPGRVLDMPSSEAAMTGVALGSTVLGMRPVLVHMRLDFAILAMDQMVNQVAKWSFMYGGKLRAPMVMRMIVGRGWGQGPQHSQSLQAWFAHVPGLRVLMPATARDAKGMLIGAIRDDAPAIVIEHRWLYDVEDDVPEEAYETPLDGAVVRRVGDDVTIAATSYMTLEALRAADALAAAGVSAEIVDLRALAPLDVATLTSSVKRTGALIVADTGTVDYGVGAEVVARVVEEAHGALRRPPRRIGLPFAPSPTAPALAEAFFPRAVHIAEAAAEILGVAPDRLPPEPDGPSRWRDTPDRSFSGPY